MSDVTIVVSDVAFVIGVVIASIVGFVFLLAIVDAVWTWLERKVNEWRNDTL